MVPDPGRVMGPCDDSAGGGGAVAAEDGRGGPDPDAPLTGTNGDPGVGGGPERDGPNIETLHESRHDATRREAVPAAKYECL